MLFISLFFLGMFILTSKYKRKNLLSIIIHSISVLMYFLLLEIYFIANFFTGKGLDESVIITLQLGLSNAGFKEYISLIVTSIFLLLLTIIGTYFYYCIIKQSNNYAKKKQNCYS